LANILCAMRCLAYKRKDMPGEDCHERCRMKQNRREQGPIKKWTPTVGTSASPLREIFFYLDPSKKLS
jgi:hypothetical protein